jgi:aminoglycoside phosphotransferase (APT) family kinase protein
MPLNITISTAIDLIAEQFPEFSHLAINPVELSGHDNRSFRLGENMLIRLPSAEAYALKVTQEQKHLPILSKNLSLSIPTPIKLGKASKDYPWNWSIYQWIEGTSLNIIPLKNLNLEQIALDLAKFLNELHAINSNNGFTQNDLLPGKHNFFRGGHPSVYDLETRSAIHSLKGFIDTHKATAIWEKAIESKWIKAPVWIHGDIASGNILIKEKKMTAIIDFGSMGLGDPACDLVMAWSFFNNSSKEIFQKYIEVDNDTWSRAKGWALWKALITIDSLKDKTCLESIRNKQIIDNILD